MKYRVVYVTVTDLTVSLTPNFGFKKSRAYLSTHSLQNLSVTLANSVVHFFFREQLIIIQPAK
jgi:hypothetical protein